MLGYFVAAIHDLFDESLTSLYNIVIINIVSYYYHYPQQWRSKSGTKSSCLHSWTTQLKDYLERSPIPSRSSCFGMLMRMFPFQPQSGSASTTWQDNPRASNLRRTSTSSSARFRDGWNRGIRMLLKQWRRELIKSRWKTFKIWKMLERRKQERICKVTLGTA